MKILTLAATALFPLAAACLLSGCDAEPSGQIAISVTPNNVSLTKGQSQEFTASGWQDYTWELSETSIGVLSTKKGDSTVYTAVAAPAGGTNETEVQVLTVSVNVSSAATTTTSTSGVPVTAQSVVTAEALILHR